MAAPTPNLSLAVSLRAVVARNGSANLNRVWTLKNKSQETLDLRKLYLSLERPTRDAVGFEAKDGSGAELTVTFPPSEGGEARAEIDVPCVLQPKGSYEVRLSYKDPHYALTFGKGRLWIIHEWFSEGPISFRDEKAREDANRQFSYELVIPDMRWGWGLAKPLFHRHEFISPDFGAEPFTPSKTDGQPSYTWGFPVTPGERRQQFNCAYLVQARNPIGWAFKIASLFHI